MPSPHNIPEGMVGAHAVQLTAGTVEEFRFVEDLDSIEVSTDGAAPAYVTVDGTPPTVAGPGTWPVLAAMGSAEFDVSNVAGPTVVKVISAGTPTVWVCRGN